MTTTLADIRRSFGAERIEHTIKYIKMKRSSASVLIEFTHADTYNLAVEKMDAAFPDTKRVSRIADSFQYQLVLNTDEEATYFKMIESGLKDAV